MALLQRTLSARPAVAASPLLGATRSMATRQAQFAALPRWKRAAVALLGGAGVAGAGLGVALQYSVLASDPIVPPAVYNWDHYGHFKSLDHGSIRRGYQVYKQVCAACHAMPLLAYRHMVNVCFTEEEAKAEAAEAQIMEGPDDEGNFFQRKGKLTDYFPKPYPNDEAAKAANGGALPPALTYIVLARGKLGGEGENYIFSLLTGYCDPPAGFDMPAGKHFNPYFKGGAIGMAQQLYPEGVEYDDGTPATIPQMAKDVTIFLKWAGEFHFDDRVRLSMKILPMMALVVVVVYYNKRMNMNALKNRVLTRVYRPAKAES